jgi:hypothetical protein
VTRRRKPHPALELLAFIQQLGELGGGDDLVEFRALLENEDGRTFTATASDLRNPFADIAGRIVEITATFRNGRILTLDMVYGNVRWMNAA